MACQPFVSSLTEMKMGASEMPLQLEFDYRFSGSIKKSLKRHTLLALVHTTHTPLSLQTTLTV